MMGTKRIGFTRQSRGSENVIPVIAYLRTLKGRPTEYSSLMVISYFKKLLLKNREFILTEVLAVRGLMYLLMKNRNTDEKWTGEEKTEMKNHLRNISKVIPIIIVFLLPGGSLFLPFLAEVLDRRKKRRL